MSAERGGKTFRDGFEIFRSADETLFFLLVFLPHVERLRRIFRRIATENMRVSGNEFGAYSAHNVVKSKRAAFFAETNVKKRLQKEVAEFFDYRVVVFPHPSVAISSTEKPIELCRYAIRTFTNPGAVVLDNCCGCGSIPIAAKLEGRHYIGMDNGICDNKKSKYFGMPWADVATQRLAEIA